MDFVTDLAPAGVIAAMALLGTIMLFAMWRATVSAQRSAARAERLAQKENERVLALERELRERAATPAVGLSDALRVLEEMSGALRLTITGRSRQELGSSVGRALERLLGVEQWMVFLDEDRTGDEFNLVASGSVDQAAWPVGACLTPQMGRLGLVIRRGKALDRDDFDAEPPIVREQIESSEPRAFRVDIAAPIVLGESVVGVVAIGGPRMSLDLACAITEVLAEGAAAGVRLLEARERTARLENVDEVTGLHNRNWFTAQASEILFRNADHDAPMSLAVFGIDELEEYADHQGQAGAQRLLQGVAKLLRPIFRDADLLCRWSDDEFAVLMPGIDRARATVLLDRLRRRVAGEAWTGAEDQPRGAVTVSAGLAVAPHDGSRFDALIAAARRAHAVSVERGGDRTSGELRPACDVGPEDTLHERSRDAALSLGDTVDLPDLPGDVADRREVASRDLGRDSA